MSGTRLIAESYSARIRMKERTMTNSKANAPPAASSTPPTLTLPHRGLRAVTFWPAELDPNEMAEPGKPYKLEPRHGGVNAGTFSFVEDQRLVALVTHSDDDDWVLNSHSVALAIDPLCATAMSDIPFSIFHTVAGLALLSEVNHRKIIEQVTFSMAATLFGEPARMRHGVTVLFVDEVKWNMHRRYFKPVGDFDIERDETLDFVPFQTVVVHHPEPLAGLDGIASAAARHGFASAGELVDAIASDPDLAALRNADVLNRYEMVLRAFQKDSRAIRCLIDAFGLASELAAIERRAK